MRSLEFSARWLSGVLFGRRHTKPVEMTVAATRHPRLTLVWPIELGDFGLITISSPDGTEADTMDVTVLSRFASETFENALSSVEFDLFVDLAASSSVEEASNKAGVALFTRRKQLQS